MAIPLASSVTGTRGDPSPLGSQPLGHFLLSSFFPFLSLRRRGALNEIRRPHLSFFPPFQTGPRDRSDGRQSARGVRPRARSRTQRAGWSLAGFFSSLTRILLYRVAQNQPFFAALYLAGESSTYSVYLQGVNSFFIVPPPRRKKTSIFKGLHVRMGATTPIRVLFCVTVSGEKKSARIVIIIIAVFCRCAAR